MGVDVTVQCALHRLANCHLSLGWEGPEEKEAQSLRENTAFSYFFLFARPSGVTVYSRLDVESERILAVPMSVETD